MKARDVMISPVITVSPATSVGEIAKKLLTHRISAVPVVTTDGKLVGLVSEGDLMRRSESETEHRRSWWLQALTDSASLAADYVRAHARKAEDVMTRHVVVATPDMPLHEIAGLLETNHIKRVPIVEDGRVIGVVSRANLIQAVASAKAGPEIQLSDITIRENIVSSLDSQPWAHRWSVNVIVQGGVVDLWGIVESDAERDAIRVTAENAPGVRRVNNHLLARPMTIGA